MPLTAASKSTTSAGRQTLRGQFAAVVGDDGVRDDQASLDLHSEDIWSASPHKVCLIVSPRTIEEVQAVLRIAKSEGLAIAPRGAGMSYTSSYIPQTDDTLSLDMSRMDRVLHISPQDMTVTVEPGCTWADLNGALKPLGLRTPFWGPMSGLTSTIGGGLSQLNAMLGAGHYGTSSESVIALTMVLADGSVLKTGARGVGGENPFYRHYGPDLAGLFCGDSGVFGVKAEITFRLIRAPAHEDYASFSFPTGEALLRAMAETARAGLASEMCAFDPGLTRVRMKRASLASDVKTLGAVIGKQKSLGKGLLAAAKIALGGRSFIDEGDYSLHVIAEGRSEVGVAQDVAEARRIALAEGGHEIENTIARVIRAVPFPPLNSILGPEGERWAPVHGMVALSQAPALFGRLQELFSEMAPAFEREGVFTGYLFTSVSTNALTLEPVFYWPEARTPIHEATIETSHLSKLPIQKANPGATAVVAEARRRVVEFCTEFGCAHYQIGRSYPYRDSRDTASIALLDAVKQVLDPGRRLNPGGLGFPMDGTGQ